VADDAAVGPTPDRTAPAVAGVRPEPPAWSVPPSDLVVVVGGVGQLFQSDQDLGRHVVERLERSEHVPPGALVEDLSYGAIAVSHRLRELAPATLVLVGAIERGRPPGTVHRRRVVAVERSEADLQGAVLDAGTGYVDLDLTLEVAWAFGALPDRTVVLEVEPAATGPGDRLSAVGRGAVEAATAAALRECHLAFVFDLVERLRPRLAPGVLEPSAVRTALCDLVDALDVLDHEDRWGRTFAAKDAVQLAVAAGDVGPDVDRADWAVLWGLVEAVQVLEVASVSEDVLGS
jgi:hydrogenase maturation protease